MRVSIHACLRNACLAAAAAAWTEPAHAGFTAPAFVSHRGSPRAEYAAWESFTDPVGGSNAPDDPATTAGAAFAIVQENAGAFLIGGNVYSFSGPTSFVLSHVPAPAQAVPDLTRLALQISTLGNELDYGTVQLEYLDAGGAPRLLPYDSRTELARYATSIGYGESVESLFEWDLSAVGDEVRDYRVRFASAVPHVSLDAVVVDALWSDEPFSYCAPATGACAPAIGWSGAPSLSSGLPFVIHATGAAPGQSGLLFYGTTGAKQVLFKGSWRCVGAPLRRTAVQGSGGGGACTGTFAFDFNAHLAGGEHPSLAAFDTVHAQYWFLDPTYPGGSGTSDALQFVLHP
jgi:hypothetical protein